MGAYTMFDQLFKAGKSQASQKLTSNTFVFVL